jgi:hypothetical protein
MKKCKIIFVEIVGVGDLQISILKKYYNKSRGPH